MATDRHQAPSYPLRMPDELKTKIADAAEANNRSLHAELLDRLEETFRPGIPKAALHTVLELSYDLAAARTNQRSIQLRLTEICELILVMNEQSKGATAEELRTGLSRLAALAGPALEKHRATFDELRSAYREAEAAAVDLVAIQDESEASAKGGAQQPKTNAAEPMLKELRAGNIIRRTRRPEQASAEQGADALVRKRLVGNLGSDEESAPNKVIVRATPLKPRPASKGPVPNPNARKPKP